MFYYFHCVSRQIVLRSLWSLNLGCLSRSCKKETSLLYYASCTPTHLREGCSGPARSVQGDEFALIWALHANPSAGRVQWARRSVQGDEFALLCELHANPSAGRVQWARRSDGVIELVVTSIILYNFWFNTLMKQRYLIAYYIKYINYIFNCFNEFAS